MQCPAEAGRGVVGVKSEVDKIGGMTKEIIVASRLENNHFFVNSEILRMHIWRGKNPHKLRQILNCDKLRK